MHQVSQLPHHAFVCAEIIFLGQDETEVEDKLISVISSRFHTDWVSQNPISVGANLEQVTAELLARDHEERDVGKGQEEGLRLGSGGGNDSPIRDLVHDLGTCSRQVIVSMINLCSWVFNLPLTLLRVESAVEDCFDHGEAVGAQCREIVVLKETETAKKSQHMHRFIDQLFR